MVKTVSENCALYLLNKRQQQRQARRQLQGPSQLQRFWIWLRKWI